MADTSTCPACGKELLPNAGMCSHCGKGISGKYLLAEQEAQRMAARGVVTATQSQFISVTAFGVGATIFCVLAFLSIPVGLLFASNATSGVAILAAGAILAVIARINQAGLHHREGMSALTLRRGQ